MCTTALLEDRNNTMIFLWEIYSIFLQISSIVLVLQHGRRAHTLYRPRTILHDPTPNLLLLLNDFESTMSIFAKSLKTLCFFFISYDMQSGNNWQHFYRGNVAANRFCQNKHVFFFVIRPFQATFLLKVDRLLRRKPTG